MIENMKELEATLYKLDLGLILILILILTSSPAFPDVIPHHTRRVASPSSHPSGLYSDWCLPPLLRPVRVLRSRTLTHLSSDKVTAMAGYEQAPYFRKLYGNFDIVLAYLSRIPQC